MRYFLLVFALLFCISPLLAQRGCPSAEYKRISDERDPGLSARVSEIESFTRQKLQRPSVAAAGVQGEKPIPDCITIPVVVHIVYRSADQNISDEQISSQIDVLNRDYGKLNADTARIPSYFRSLSANCGFRFALAAVDTNGNHTTGIVRKHTVMQSFSEDDAIKFTAKGGDNAWDRDHYLNIWVGCLTEGILGYSSVPGCSKATDGVVVNFTDFGTTGTARAPYNLGRTATHEIGHWLNLIHIWGDANCGDDDVDDTPPQKAATAGDPSGMIFSCGNSSYGNLYMDFMDFTDDIGMHLFTYGQRARMRTLFTEGGFRQSLLGTADLVAGTSTRPPAEEVLISGSGQDMQIYPNPAMGSVRISSGQSFKQSALEIYNQLGQRVLVASYTGTSLSLNVSSLPRGLYFVKVNGQKESCRLLKM